MCIVYRELHKITIKISALYLEQMIYGINCQQHKSFPGMIWGPDITPKPCNHCLSFAKMPFYSHSCNCLLVSSSKLDTIQYYLIPLALQPNISYYCDLPCLCKPIIKCAIHFYSTLYDYQNSSALGASPSLFHDHEL